MLKIGDRVDWRGGWGHDAPQCVTVTGIESVAVGEKHGEAVEAIAWTAMDQVVVDLDNGHWAYGYQLTRMPR